MDENERAEAALVVEAAAASRKRLVAEGLMPKPGIIGVYGRGGYSVIAWISEDGGYHETVGQYAKGEFKRSGNVDCPFITNAVS